MPDTSQHAELVPVGYWYCSTHSGLLALDAEVCDLAGLNPDMRCDRRQLMYCQHVFDLLRRCKKCGLGNLHIDGSQEGHTDG